LSCKGDNEGLLKYKNKFYTITYSLMPTLDHKRLMDNSKEKP